MIGRQMMLVDADSLQSLLASFGVVPRSSQIEELNKSCEGGYAEPLLHLLGADEVVSIDADQYEGATVLHDLNSPIPPQLKGRFDVVLDGGTLEHIFNFPMAIRNCMEMTAVGGHLLSSTAGNNFPGHGFYQFSPELFYRIFCPENGFVMERAIVSETQGESRWYRVPDPKDVGRRVEFISIRPTYLIVQARKCREREPFRTVPQQSDYVALWEHQTAVSPPDEQIAACGQRSLRERVAAVARRVPGAVQLVRRLRGDRASKMYFERLSGGPHGPFLEECERV